MCNEANKINNSSLNCKTLVAFTVFCVQSDLLGKSIYTLVHSEDRHEFERCLSLPEDDMQSSCSSPLSNRSSSFSCRVLVKSGESSAVSLFQLYWCKLLPVAF